MPAGLTLRPWDTAFFGFRVAEIDARELDERSLADYLLAARDERCELVYWRTDPQRALSPELLDRFAGQLVDRRVTYRLLLHEADSGGAAAMASAVCECPVGPASEQLRELAIVAGQFSRFKTDRRFPTALFEALYRRWIDRSTLHEIADAVLVAPGGAAANGAVEMLGMSTISAADERATIGLIAVRAEVQGKGIARALMSASHAWMLDRGLRESFVTTQEANRRACALYERCGYRVGEHSLFYHFWPTHDAGF
ncbi:MAG TPA: GNAT family N-acetyltransferase [Pirellulales bacterium]|nr:GNAT family N-acetyltransferase [Pirellulales bacterium]